MGKNQIGEHEVADAGEPMHSDNPFTQVLRNLEYQKWYNQTFNRTFLKIAAIGAKVLLSTKKPRNKRHELGDLIQRTYLELAKQYQKPTAEQVRDALEKYDEEEIIQEILDNGDIHWIDWRGKQHTMRLPTLRNRLIKLRPHTRISASSS